MNDLLGVIVDGDGDFASLKRRFSGQCRILKTDGPRGHDAIIADIVTRSKKQIGMLRAFRCDRVIVVLDFEERIDPYPKFVSHLREAFARTYHGVEVFVAVPNKMIENWYLADIEEISRQKIFIRDGLRQKHYEGKHGKAEIKKCMIHGTAYSETQHGPQMFAILRFDVARTNSPSLAEFLDMMQRGCGTKGARNEVRRT